MKSFFKMLAVVEITFIVVAVIMFVVSYALGDTEDYWIGMLVTQAAVVGAVAVTFPLYNLFEYMGLTE